MKPGFTTLGKVLAVCFSLALLSGYVGWRYTEAKKEDVRRQAAIQAAKLATDKADAEQDELLARVASLLKIIEDEGPGAIMPSSKSGFAVPSLKSRKATEDLAKLLEEHPELSKQLGQMVIEETELEFIETPPTSQ